jgi:hypothetical protein
MAQRVTGGRAEHATGVFGVTPIPDAGEVMTQRTRWGRLVGVRGLTVDASAGGSGKVPGPASGAPKAPPPTAAPIPACDHGSTYRWWFRHRAGPATCWRTSHRR